MGQMIRPSQVRIITKDGEVTIQLVLDINVNINQTGGLTVAVQNERAAVVTERVKDGITFQEDEFEPEIPDFTSFSGLNFGKTVE